MGEIVCSATHPGSGRVAVVAAEGDSMWLYLSAPGQGGIAGDCWLANTGPALPRADLRPRAEAYRRRGAPPPAPREVVAVDAQAGRPVPAAAALGFRWTADGEGVAVLLDGALWGLIAPGARRGASRDLVVEGPWGAPLDPELARTLFGLPAAAP